MCHNLPAPQRIRRVVALTLSLILTTLSPTLALAGSTATATTAAVRSSEKAAAPPTPGQAKYPDGTSRSFSNIVGIERLRSDAGLLGRSVDEPRPGFLIIGSPGPAQLVKLPLAKIAAIAVSTDKKHYDGPAGYPGDYLQIEVTTRDGKKESFFTWGDSAFLNVEWSDSIAVSTYPPQDLKGVTFSLK